MLPISQGDFKLEPALCSISMGSEPPNRGGIDFNPTNLNLEIKGDGIQVPELNFDPAQLGQMNIDGFYPVIYNIVPVMNLPMLLGVSEGEKQPAGEGLRLRSGQAQDKAMPPEVSYAKSPALKESEYELAEAK